MIKFRLHDPLHIQIELDHEWDFLRALKRHLTEYKDGFQYSPKYKTGRWDGKICVMNTYNRTFPYGLFTEVLRFLKKNFPDLDYYVSDSVKRLFKGIDASPEWNLLYEPHDYQEDCILTPLKYSKGIIRAATAAGKSLMIAYILRELLQENEIQQGVIIVPNKGLIKQFHEDLLEYGIDPDLIGEYWQKEKQIDKPIVVSTWQSLNLNKKEMKRFGCVIVDEVHGAKAQVLKELLAQATTANYRYGFTGTMPTDRLDTMNIVSYLGPVLRDYGSKKLAEMGYVNECLIKQVQLNYEDTISGDYNDVREAIFQNRYRMGLIRHLINASDKSILVLVERVEKEGEVLEGYLKNSPELYDREIVFLSGRDDADEREAWRKYADNNDNIVLIATYQIFQVGINIKSLQNLILAVPSKSKIRVLQSIGRTLRKMLHKGVAIIWDVVDNVKFLDDHAEMRMRHYTMEGFEVEEYELFENVDITYELRRLE